MAAFATAAEKPRSGADLVEAYAWLTLAAPVRATGAARLREALRPQLSIEELRRADALAQARRMRSRLTRELQLDEK